MSLPILIIGSNEKNRKQKALEKATENSNKFDIAIFDTSQTKAISELRTAISKIHKKPFSSKYQSFIILEAQNLSLEAQNTLLKTLEEPPESTLLFLTAPSRESLLATIGSRCSLLELPFEKVQTTFSKFENFAKKTPMARFKSLDLFDVDEWASYYRSVFLSEVNNSKNEGSTKVLQLLNYLRLTIKVKKALRKNVSKKIAKTLLLLEAPKI